MAKIYLGGLEAETPPTWQDQGMITFTIPSPDKNVKPNIIMTKETLPQAIGLKEYFQKIKESIVKRGIRDFKISDEREIIVGGARAMQMVCTWDVSAMRQMLGTGGGPVPEIKPGQMVKQVQVTILKDTTAVNLTGSFPAEQFDIYYRPFQNFLKSIKLG
ncbi:MAG: DcrB-related protein [Deltaproteobacteria bacterium]|nr:DcrB-related protein [Deltaproteobacteria bacterium]MBI4196236.1 DcrB-related protein [Deltaproteobacteria bacterium]